MPIVLTPSNCTNSGNNTASTSWSVQCPVQVPGDIIICHLVSDANVTHGTLPGGPNGESAVVLMDAKGDGAAGVVVSVWYWIATGSSAAHQRTVTPSATEQWQATVVRIPAGEYDTVTPIQYASYFLAGSSAAIVSPNLIPNKAGARAVFWAGIDADTVTGISQQAGTTWTLLANVDVGAITGVFAYRETVTGRSVTITSGNLSGASDNYVSVGYLINEPTTYEPTKGALTLTGYTPQVVQTAAPDGGFFSLALLGIGAGIVQEGGDQTIAPSKGALTLTGKQPTIAQTAHQILEPAKGSLSLAGYVPTLEQPQALTPTAGTLTLTGNIATLAQTANQSLEAVTGHLTATGYAPGVERTANQTVGPPTTGNLALTGQTATVSQPREYTPTAGGLTLTGRVPTIEQTGGFGGFFSLALLGLNVGANTGEQSLTPATGHLTLTGNVPTVIAPASLTPTTGHLTLTGKVPTVGNQEVIVEWDDITGEDGYRVKWGTATGDYSWSADVAADATSYEIKGLTYGVRYYVAIYGLVGGVEQDPSDEITFVAGLWHVPTTGHLTLTGNTPEVVQGSAQSVTPSKGNLALGGKVATVVQPRDMTPAAGSLTLTGYAPTVAQARVVEPAKGALSLTGYVPTLTQPRSLDPVPGHLALAGSVPTVTQARTVDPTTGSLTLTGYEPSVTQTAGQVIAPTAGSLTLTGYAPEVTLVGPILIAPETGHLYLRGYVPTITGPTYPRTGAGGIGGGRGGKKPKRRIWIEPEDDGPVLELETAAEVPKALKSVKRQAKAIAERAIKQREPIPELPQWVVHGDAPFADDLRQRIDEIRANFAYVYQLMLIEQRRRDDEDEDDVFLLTL